MRLSDYRPVLGCALVYDLAVVLAGFAFEDGSNAATVVSVRCAFAALATMASPVAALAGGRQTRWIPCLDRVWAGAMSLLFRRSLV